MGGGAGGLSLVPNTGALCLGEGRQHSRADAGEIALLVRRSLDGGRTWEAPRVVVQVYLDGKDVLRFRLPSSGPLVPTCFGSAPNGTGTSFWRWASYVTKSQREAEYVWLWDARSGGYPDQYESERMLELHAKTHEQPDNGYSSWVQLDDGEILVLDYTNEGDRIGLSHIVGCSVREEDFTSMGRRG